MSFGRFGFGFSLGNAKAPTVPYLPIGAIVVSASAYGVLPAGNDTTGTGTAAAPYATLAKALTVVADGGQIVLNGNPASPTIYAAATFYNITKGMRIESVYPYGAALQATGAQTRVLNINPTLGQTVQTGKIIVDANNMTLAGCVLLNDQATTYSYIAKGTRFINWTSQGVASVASATTTKVNLSLYGCTFTGGSTRSAIYFKGLIAGAIIVSGCTINITSQNASGHGGMIAQALATGVSCSFMNNILNLTLDGVAGSSTTYGVQILNIPNANISRNIITATGVSGGRPVEAIQVCALSSAPLDSSGAYVGYNLITHNANGGLCIEIGEDNQDSGSRGFQNGAIVERNSVVCNALSAAGTTHGIFNSAGANSIVRNNLVKNSGIALVDKEGDGGSFYNNISVGASNSHIRLKGSKNCKFSHNTIVEGATATSWPILVSNNVTNSHVGSGSTVVGNAIYVSVASGRYLSAETAENVGFSYNDYYATGALVTNPWLLGATGYPSLSAWKAAAEATAISVDPQFVASISDNYDIAGSASLLNIVPADPAITTDYLGRLFSSPASVGAYQKQ